MVIDRSTGTEAAMDLTSYDVITSPGSSFTFCMCCMKCWLFLRWCGDLTFSLRPDKVGSVWRQWKLVLNNMWNHFVSETGVNTTCIQTMLVTYLITYFLYEGSSIHVYIQVKQISWPWTVYSNRGKCQKICRPDWVVFLKVISHYLFKSNILYIKVNVLFPSMSGVWLVWLR